MTDPITVRTINNVENGLDATAAHLRHLSTPITRLGRWMCVGMLILMTLSIPTTVLSKLKDQPPNKVSEILIGYGVTFAFLWGWVYRTRPKNWFKRQAIRQLLDQDPTSNSTVCFRFGTDEIDLQTEHAESSLRWTSYSKIVESPGGYLLYQGVQPISWLPAAGFASDEEVSRFASLAKDRVPHYVVTGKCRFPGKPKPPVFEEL